MALVWVTRAEHLHDYMVELTFNDGTQSVVDFSKILDMRIRFFAPLLDMEVFKKFTLDGWTLTWKDGTIDVAPEYLYEAATTQSA